MNQFSAVLKHQRQVQNKFETMDETIKEMADKNKGKKKQT